MRPRTTSTSSLATLVAIGLAACAGRPDVDAAPSLKTEGDPTLAAIATAARSDRLLSARVAPNPRAYALAGASFVASAASPASVAPLRPIVASVAVDGDAAWTVASDRGDEWVRLTPIGEVAGAATIDHGRVVRRDVRAATDAVHVASDTDAELLYVLRDETAPTTWDYRFERSPTLPRATFDRSGALSLTNARGRERMFVARPYALDAHGARREATLRLRGDRLEIKLDPRGLAYPIVMDPYVGTARWLRPTLTPMRRSEPGFAPLGTNLVLFGGHDQAPYDDTWTWDGNAWGKASTPVAPSARVAPAMATLGDKIVLFGGQDETAMAPLDDTWSWDGTSWTKLSPAHHPSARQLAGVATLGGKIVLFGGQNGAALTDTWTFDGTDWTQLSPANSPQYGPEAMATFGADVFMVLQDDTISVTPQTWKFDGAKWTDLSAAAATPTATEAYSLGVIGGKLYLVTGADDATSTFGTYVWSGSTWTPIPLTNAPPPRSLQALAPLGSQLVMFGGDDPMSDASLDDLWSFDGAKWTQLQSHESPDGRFSASMTTLDDRAVLFGGNDGYGFPNDTWEWDGARWNEIATKTSPPGRFNAALATVGTTATLYGGDDDSGGVGDLWTWDHKNWTSVSAPTDPQADNAHAIGLGATMLLIGDAVPLQHDSWTSDGTAFKEVALPSGVVDVDVLIPFGGKGLLVDASSGTQWLFAPATGWSAPDTASAASVLGNTSEAGSAAFGRFAVTVIERVGPDGFTAENGSFLYDGTKWRELALVGMDYRNQFAMAAQGGSVVMNGGSDVTGLILSDTLLLDLSLSQGADCKADSECETSHCAQGVCCNTACAGATESCAQPATKGTCAPVLAACTDATTLQGADGTSTSCAPYLCVAAACVTQCTSTSQCIGGYVCDDGSSTCVPVPTSGGATSGGGCTIGEGVGSTRFPGWIAIAAIALARRRRRGR